MASRKPALNRIEVLQGTLDLIVLQSLRWRPQHGYGLVQFIRAHSRGVLDVDAGSLYPALHRLEAQRAISASWDTAPSGQRVRLYQLTRKGQSRLAQERSRWEQFTDVMTGLFVPPATGEA